jgi:general secretion pathway protein D
MDRRLITHLYPSAAPSPLRSLRLSLFLAMLFPLFAAGTAHAQSAAAWDKRGLNAAARDDYDGAFQDYRKAHEKSPKDLKFQTHYESMRFKAGASHVDHGRVLLQGGDTTGALTEFLRALEIDPSNQTAQQEINKIRDAQTSGSKPSGASMQQTARQSEALKEIASVTGIIQLKPVSNDPITLHTVEDTKNIYQAIGKLAGLNVLFDPDYTSKRIPIDLVNVNLSDALRIVGTVSETFYKPVTSNTIFVAANTRQKRTDLEELAVQTFYLTNMSTAADATEVLTAIRNVMDPSVKIFLVPSQNAIVMRATPDQLMLAEKLLNDLDRAKPEVVVDVAVLQVDRQLERTLGLQLPQSFGLSAQANPNATNTTSTATTGTTTNGTTTTSSNFTLNSLAHLSANNFAVTIGGAMVNALLTDSDTRILQNPRIRASDGQRATLKIGEKIPIATGSYSAGAATGLTAGIGVQTQFSYIDVGVNIDMTPTVHYDREVTLKLSVEVSSEANQVTISGVTEPIIAQNKAEQVIQLQDGEPSILAGLLTKSTALSISGTPGLSELPFLKYVFGSRDKITMDNEIIFILVPHIVRESVLSRLNTRAIDTGTGQAIELRHDPAALAASDMDDAENQPAPPMAPATTAAAAAAAAVHTPTNPDSPTQMPSVPTGAPVNLTVQPANANQAVGSTFQVSVMAANAQDLFSVPLQLQFNPAVLQLVNVDAGPFLGTDGQAVAMAHREDNGNVIMSSSRPPNTKGVSGQGSVYTVTFKAIAAGDSNLSLSRAAARNSSQISLPTTTAPAVVHVQ